MSIFERGRGRGQASEVVNSRSQAVLMGERKKETEAGATGIIPEAAALHPTRFGSLS
nr:hypothetical protein [Tanacetum cinerariifolium]